MQQQLSEGQETPYVDCITFIARVLVVTAPTTATTQLDTQARQCGAIYNNSACTHAYSTLHSIKVAKPLHGNNTETYFTVPGEI